MGYLKLTLSDAIIEEAVSRMEKIGVLKGSHRKEAANLVGAIGEVMFERFMKSQNIEIEVLTDRTDMDYRLCGKWTVDVKTKDRTVLPKAHYDNSVPLYNHDHQKPDLYFFISLLRDKEMDDEDPNRFTDACLVGGIERLILEKDGKVWKKDQVDPRNGTRFWTDCINVSMEQLMGPKDFINLVKLD